MAWHLAFRSSPPLAERSHTRYDPELGWVNRKSVALPDFYGPGAHLHVNAQGFRGRRDVAPEPAPGRVRVVCSGDSFALGYGVDDAETWCQQLERIDARLETVNMGQGGYGIGQSWLWFARDGEPLAPDVHLFSFIVEDFERLRSTSFFGYGKPRVRLGAGGLRVDNVPVPRGAYAVPWLVHNAHLFDRLRSVRFLRAVLRSAPPDAPSEIPEDLAELAFAVFEDLQHRHGEAGRLLVLVYLPMIEEYRGRETDEWRLRLRREAARRGIVLFDLVEPLRELPPDRIEALFLQPGRLAFPAAAGHYTAAGNRLVAEWIHARLQRMPAFERIRSRAAGNP